MKVLLWLYPRAWRTRYQTEMEALLHRTRLTPGVAWDLLRGGLDARLHPQWPGRRTGRRGIEVVLIVASAVLLGSGAFFVATAIWSGASRPVAVSALSSAALGALLASWRLRRRRGTCRSDDDLEGGAAVPARPRPSAPPVLSAASPGSDRRSDLE